MCLGPENKYTKRNIYGVKIIKIQGKFNGFNIVFFHDFIYKSADDSS